MKRVGIITLYHNNSNYGGILQAYALNSAVCALGYDCRVIDYVQTPMRASEKLNGNCAYSSKKQRKNRGRKSKTHIRPAGPP